MGVSKNNGTPKSSILIGFSIIFTIHFGDIYHYSWVDTQIFRHLQTGRATVCFTQDEYRAAGATRVVALVKEDVDKEVEEFRILPSRYVILLMAEIRLTS